MNTQERLKMVAPCGIDCGICELYLCKDNKQLYNILISKGISKESIPCKGCRSVQGDCPVINGKCATYSCVTAKKADFCFKCDEYPCNKLQPAADRASILPHNLKVFNLAVIEKAGLSVFVEKSSEIKNRYYTGKMLVGLGPQITE